MEKLQVNSEDVKKRLDIFILDKFPSLSRNVVKNMIVNGDVLVNNSAVKAGYSIKIKDEILIKQVEKKTLEILPQDIKLDIVYEDDDLIVINKKQGMIVHPAGNIVKDTLENALLFHCKDNLSDVNGNDRKGIVHRIDKDTSGLLVVAKNNETHLALQTQIQTRIFKRKYVAVCHGKFKEQEGDIKNYLEHNSKRYEKFVVSKQKEGRFAHTKYKVIDYYDGFSLVEFELVTGRTHQIRVHSAYIGHSVVGDNLYGEKQNEFDLKGQLLHSYKISFIHPKTKKELSFVADLPNYFENFAKEKKLNYNLLK